MPDKSAEIPGRGGGGVALQAEMLFNRLRKRHRHLKKWARRRGTDAYRLYDRDIPEIPLVLDLYGDAVSGALYQRPYEKDEAEEAFWLRAMTAAAAGALDIPETRIFLKRRQRQRGAAQYERQGDRRFIRNVREGGLCFRVNLSDYLDTGLFLDRRSMRDLVRAESAGKRILNLFSYTASFSVHAAAGGARQVDSVDLSNTYLDWGELNFRLNGFEPRRISPGELFRRRTGQLAGTGTCRLIRADVLGFLGEAAEAGASWDTIILDPPAFSNSKKMSGTLDIRRDYRSLVSRCLSLLAPGGRLWFSAGSRDLRLDPDEFRSAEFPDLRIEDMGKRMTDEDFRGKKTPVCYRFQL